ncbi:L-threonylcarbamoyladenylate synthase [Halobium salinum]|uniref:L-threonylcarbamoyladenylate synthase n=1 Tax=Halobium salinum TaxID=1364940 RepID=A0ABD5P8N6_9EURY|nr:L-threonylcarbamoyladenylate synthase [Halobium salinum]
MPADDALDSTLRDAVVSAASAVHEGEAVVYPTETVYGLGADALSTAAVERVFEIKGRDRDKPLSLAAPSVDAALEYVRPTEREERFMRAFLPGPVTVVVERGDSVPDALTAGRDRVGVRVPDHPVALALLREAAPTPVTATSANLSGAPSVTDPADLDPSLRERVAAVVDGGVTPGTESTVVDPGAGVIHRRGALGDEIREWLASN